VGAAEIVDAAIEDRIVSTFIDIESLELLQAFDALVLP
jgi:hypothetical protein